MLGRLPLALLLATTLPCGFAASASPRFQTAPQVSGATTGNGGNPEQGGAGRTGRRGAYAGMGRAAGEVTAISGSTLTLKSEDGGPMAVVTTDNTQFVKERGPVRLSDLHVGDGVMAVGNLDPATHTLHAAMVMAEDAAEVKAMRENLGKTYITGRVTAVDLDNARMTVERPDHVAQTIGLDEGTSFKRAVRRRTADEAGGGDPGRGAGTDAGPGGGAGRGYGGGMGFMAASGAGVEQAFKDGESITLADIKVGDRVVGSGALKSGVFVPVHLLDAPPGQRRGRGEAGAGGPGATAPPAAAIPGAGPGR